jgi:hypothetical protein
MFYATIAAIFLFAIYGFFVPLELGMGLLWMVCCVISGFVILIGLAKAGEWAERNLK